MFHVAMHCIVLGVCHLSQLAYIYNVLCNCCMAIGTAPSIEIIIIDINASLVRHG